MYQINKALPEDTPAIENLLDICFGPDRFKKTAYRIRENLQPIPELSFVARSGEDLLASIQYWPIIIGGTTEALLLGPIVVSPALQGQGIGVALIKDSLAKAAELGHDIVVLVGDPEYYERFGFSSAFDAGLALPGPVEDHRFLVTELAENALENVSGMIEGNSSFSICSPATRQGLKEG